MKVTEAEWGTVRHHPTALEVIFLPNGGIILTDDDEGFVAAYAPGRWREVYNDAV